MKVILLPLEIDGLNNIFMIIIANTHNIGPLEPKINITVKSTIQANRSYHLCVFNKWSNTIKAWNNSVYPPIIE